MRNRAGKGKGFPGFGFGVIGLSFLLFFVLIVTVLFWGIKEYQALPRDVVMTGSFAEVIPISFSTDQQDTIADSGEPAGFSILFYDDWLENGALQTIRYEVWSYPNQGQERIFVNGKLIETSRIETINDELIPSGYSPNLFSAYMTLDQVTSSIEINELFAVPVEQELIRQGKLYYGPGISFGFKDNELIYVEVFSQIVEGVEP